jgi:hypothetical protein
MTYVLSSILGLIDLLALAVDLCLDISDVGETRVQARLAGSSDADRRRPLFRWRAELGASCCHRSVLE